MDESQKRLSIGVGMLTIEQAASQLPFDDMVDPCGPRSGWWRGAPSRPWPWGMAHGFPGKLTDFMADGAQNSAVRRSLELPMETLTPLFPPTPSGRNWFGPAPIERWPVRQMLFCEMQKLLRAGHERLCRHGTADSDMVMVEDGTQILNIDLSNSLFRWHSWSPKESNHAPLPVVSPFKNMGELYMASASRNWLGMC